MSLPLIYYVLPQTPSLSLEVFRTGPGFLGCSEAQDVDPVWPGALALSCRDVFSGRGQGMNGVLAAVTWVAPGSAGLMFTVLAPSTSLFGLQLCVHLAPGPRDH